jgi:exopolysaccharide biosynthesis polyprenyl glycosylphosphotransferase
MNLPLIERKVDFAVGSLPDGGLGVSLERRRLRFYLGQIVADILVVVASFPIAALMIQGTSIGQPLLLAAQLLLPVFLTIALQNGTYSLVSLKDWREATIRVWTALLLSAVLLYFILSFARFHWVFSRGAFVAAIVIAAGLMALCRRASLVWLHRYWGAHPVNILLIDDNGPAVDLPHSYRITAADHGLEPRLDDPHSLDMFARFVRNMDEVIVSCPPERQVAWSMVLKGAGIQGEVLHESIQQIGALGVVHRADAALTTLMVSTGPLGLRARGMKRLLDVAVSLVALIGVIPILGLAAIAIMVEDGGPILFRQNRIGRRNQLFAIYKLRTMKVEQTDGDGNRSASKNDDRITRVGRFLRRTSIDELPQLFNVLKGDMSLVGPRPHAIGSLAGEKLFWEVDQRYWQRHSLRPGLTGLAQVRGLRGATDHEIDLTTRLQADLEYIAGWTIWRDIRILLQTALVVVHDRAF